MSRWVRYLLATPFATSLAVLAVESGVRGLLDSSTLPLVAVIGWIGYAWAVVYGVGGVLMLAGRASAKARYEAAGCTLFGGGALVQAGVTAVFIGRSPFLTLWSVFALIVFGVAGLIQAHHLARGQKLIWVEGEHK